MKLARIAALATLLLLGACAYIAPIQPPSTFYVMRHLHTAPGQQDPDLTQEGSRNADLLAAWFGNEPPVTIFASNTKRAQQTVAPLAARLGVTPRLYDPADLDGLMLEVMKEPAPVLIVGHSNTVPAIVQRLSGETQSAIAHDRFGDIWVVSGPRRRVERKNLGGS